MSWTSFILYLALAYFFYYAINLLMDFVAAGKTTSSTIDSGHAGVHYHLPALDQPIEVSEFSGFAESDFSGPELLNSGEIESSGAQRFDQIMQAASEELIECTKRLL